MDSSIEPRFEKLLRWSRVSDEDSPLFLQVMVNGKWVHYKQSPFYTRDATISSNSGFATAQKCLSHGYKYEVKEDESQEN